MSFSFSFNTAQENRSQGPLNAFQPSFSNESKEFFPQLKFPAYPDATIEAESSLKKLNKKLKELNQPVEEVVNQFRGIMKRVERKIVIYIRNVYKQASLKKEIEMLQLMRQETERTKSVYQRHKEEWIKKVLSVMTDEINHKVEDIASPVTLNQELILEAIQRELEIDLCEQASLEQIEEEKKEMPQYLMNDKKRISSCLPKEITDFSNILGKPALLCETQFLLIYFAEKKSKLNQELLPVLHKCYKIWNQKSKRVEIILAPQYQDKQDLKKLLEDIPWLAYPPEKKKIKELKEVLGINELPAVSIFKRGAFITSKGREIILQREQGAIHVWE